MSAYDLCHFGQDLCVKKWVIESFTYSIFSFRIHSFFSFAVSFDTIFVCATKIDKITGNTVKPNIITSNINFLFTELLYLQQQDILYLNHEEIAKSPKTDSKELIFSYQSSIFNICDRGSS